MKYDASNSAIEKFIKPIDIYFKNWLDDLKNELSEQKESVNAFVNHLLSVDAIYPCGSGRSGLIAKYSGIRLMHAGYTLYEIGHPYTRPIGECVENRKDALFCISGSGETKTVVNKARRVDEINKNLTDFKIPILSITSDKDSSLGKLSTVVIEIKGRTKNRENAAAYEIEAFHPISYLGSEFEYKALGLAELLVNKIAEIKGIDEESMRKSHDNLEV